MPGRSHWTGVLLALLLVGCQPQAMHTDAPVTATAVASASVAVWGEVPKECA